MAEPFSAATRAARLVVACIRVTDLRASVDPLSGAVTRDLRSATASAAEQAALERALRIGETWSASVLVVVAGGVEAIPTLRQASALGAQTIRVAWPPEPVGLPEADVPAESKDGVADLACDERELAVALAAAIRTVGAPDLVLCGDRSADRSTGALPAFLAAELGAAQACGLVDLQVDGRALGAERRLDGGRRERLAVPLPAVCSVEASDLRLRRATLKGTLESELLMPPVFFPAVLQASPVRLGRARPFRPRPRVTPPPPGATAFERLLALVGVAEDRDPPVLVGPVGAREAADALLQYLDRTGYAVESPASESPASESPSSRPAEP